MKAVAIMKPGVVQVVDNVPMPEIGEYECLVKIRACGICSSTDLKLIHHTHPENPKFPMWYPSILGHESAGEIVEVGKKVRYLKLGDRVVNPMGARNADKFHRSYGAMVEYAVAPDYRALKEDGVDSPFFKWAATEEDFLCKVFPNDISFVDATMILSFKETYSALRNFGTKEGMDVLVYGDGSVGMGLMLFLQPYKVNSAICVGHHDDRLQKIARIANPTRVINTNKETLEQAIGEQRFDIVIDAVGSMNIVRQGANLLKPGGKVCVMGVLNKDDTMLDLGSIPNFTSVMTFSFPYKEHRTHNDIVRFMHEGLVKTEDFISHVIPMEEAAEGVRLLESREAFKVILTFNND